MYIIFFENMIVLDEKKNIYNIIFQIQGKFSYIYELNNFINYNIPTRK